MCPISFGILPRLLAIGLLLGWVSFSELVGAQPNTVYLDESEGWETLNYRQRPGGLLTREFGRQALLIAARDELKLATRDYWLGDSMPSDPTVGQLDVRFQPDNKLSVEVVLVRNGNTDSLGKFSDDLRQGSYIDAIGDAMERHSREAFVDALRKAGFEGQANVWNEVDPLQDEVDSLLLEMTFTSQFEAVRRAHRHIRAKGESPEWLGALVRGYANLGMMTACHWHPAHKAFTARSYLYAKRLEHRQPDTAVAIWHLAYAKSLAGMHMRTVSLLEGEAAQSEQPKPPWCVLAHAYAKFQLTPTKFPVEEFPVEHQPVARLLRCVSLNYSTNGSGTLDLALQDIQAIPECYRLADDIALLSGVKPGHYVTTEAPRVLKETLYQRLDALPDLPDETRQIVESRLQSNTDDSDGEVPREHLDRQELVRALKSDSANSPVDGGELSEPSWAVLGNLIQEISFMQTWRRLKFERTQLSVPATETIAECEPLFADHPYACYLRAMTTDPDDRAEALAEAARLNPVSLEIHSMLLIEAVDAARRKEMMRTIRLNQDPVVRDLSLVIRWTDVNSIQRNMGLLMAVSPYSPTARGMLIRYQWETVAQFAQEWEKSDEPFVLLELARRYGTLDRLDDAERCLQRAIELGHEQNAYRELASIYKRQGKMDQWLETLEAFLEQPDYGLEHATVNKDIAWHFIHNRKFAKALPYAESAASSGSEFGLSVAACCYEALQNWEQAETMARSTTSRYRNAWIVWYAFCKRTGHGDLEAARRMAQLAVTQIESQSDDSHAYVAMYYVLEEKPELALKHYDGLGKKNIDTSNDMHALLLAIELEDEDKQAQAIGRLNTLGPKFNPSRKTLLAIGKLIAADAAQEERGQLDMNQVDQLLRQIESYDGTNALYFLGRYHELCGKQELAERFYRDGMTSTSINFGSRTLCGARLHAAGMRPDDFLDGELSVSTPESSPTE